jgi:hypothetical protein
MNLEAGHNISIFSSVLSRTRGNDHPFVRNDPGPAAASFRSFLRAPPATLIGFPRSFDSAFPGQSLTTDDPARSAPLVGIRVEGLAFREYENR